MIRSEIKAGIHHFIVMRYCCIHLAFDLSLAFSGCCLPVCLTDAGGRVAGQLQAKPKGGVAYSYQLHCSILRMQRSEIKRAHQMRGGGVKVEEIIFPISAQAMISSQLLIWQHGNDALLKLCVLCHDNSLYQSIVSYESGMEKI